MDKKVEKCDWDRCSCCVLPSRFESHNSELSLGAAEEAETVWLPGDKVGRDSREVWFIEKFPWSGLLTKVDFCSASCSVLQEVVRWYLATHKVFSDLKPAGYQTFLWSFFEVTEALANEDKRTHQNQAVQWGRGDI